MRVKTTEGDQVANVQESRKKLDSFLKSSRNALPRLPATYEAIVNSVFSEDPEGDFDAIVQSLRIGEKRTDRNTLLKANDDAEDCARRAHRLYLSALLAVQGWKLDVEVLTASMRSEATRELQREKTEGLRSKQITDADVVAKMAVLHPDEFRDRELFITRLDGMVEHLRKLADLATMRCTKTQTMINGIR